MNIFQQLQAANVPQPPSAAERDRDRKRVARSASLTDAKEDRMLAARRASIDKAHKMHTDKAINRYREAMLGKGWMTTARVEMAIGCAATTANPFLRKLFNELKLIERRPRDGKPYNRRAGWEWRWMTNKGE